MAAASMLRSAAAGALRHRPVVGSNAATFPPLRGGLHHLHGVVGAGSSPLPPPAAAAAMAMTASASRHLSTTKTKPNAPAEERRKQQALPKVEATKDEMLRELVCSRTTAPPPALARAR